MTTYIHYGSNEFIPEAVVPIHNSGWQTKPEGGLQASRVDDTFGWKDWCEDNHFCLERLRHVERLLKLDPKNTELLSQKQEKLSANIKNTKDKLDALKTAQEQAKTQMENGDLGKDKYEALQREIIATEEELKKLAKEAADTNTALNKIDSVGKTMEKVGGTMTSAGQTLGIEGLSPKQYPECPARLINHRYVRKFFLAAWNGMLDDDIKKRRTNWEAIRDSRKTTALQKVRAKQMLEITERGAAAKMDEEVPEIIRMVLDRIGVIDQRHADVYFLDGTVTHVELESEYEWE